MTETAKPGRVDLWVCPVDEARNPVLLEKYAALLSPEERNRWHRFVRAEDAHLYLVAHALLRTVLSRYAGTPPGSLRFDAGPHGRPELPGEPRLRFNLSHASGAAVVAVTAGGAVGVDVEPVEPRSALDLPWRHFFAREEAAWLASLPEPRAREAFFELWTLKEAYLKARGVGLSLPLESFAFDLGAPGRVRFAPPPGDPSEGWNFALIAPNGRYRLAVAVERSVVGIDLRAQRAIPLAEVGPLSCAILARGEGVSTEKHGGHAADEEVAARSAPLVGPWGRSVGPG